MLWNQTIELDTNGEPVTNVITDAVITQYINEFVSNKSQIETLISSYNYNITIDINEMDLSGINSFFIYNFFY